MPSKAASPRNLLTSLVLIFPLFLVYQLGVLVTLPMLNGADFITVLLFQSLGLSLKGYLGFLGGLLVLFFGAVMVLRRHQRFESAMILPVVLESLIWALTMGSLIVFVMTKILGINPRLVAGIEGQGLVTRFVMSLGAGVYEELVFRLGFMSGLAIALEKLFGVVHWVSLLVALVVSAIVFSAMHHLPPYGDPLTLSPFVFRILAGIFFGLLFWRRGLAVAVYTHAFYDIFVLVVK